MRKWKHCLGLAAIMLAVPAQAEEAYVTRFRDGALLMKTALERMQGIDRSNITSYCSGVKAALAQLNKAEFALMQSRSMATSSGASAETIRLIEDNRIKASAAAGKLLEAKASRRC